MKDNNMGAGTRGRLGLILMLVLVTANLLVYLPAIEGKFLWDDDDLIVNNMVLRDKNFLSNVFFSPFDTVVKQEQTGASRTQFYRPITSLSYWLDLQAWGLNPAGFHLTNLVLHMLNTLLLFFLVRPLLKNDIAAFFSAFLFGLYPMHFENVAWISGRTDTLSFFFAILCLLFLARFLRKEQERRLPVSALCFLFSLLAKENNLPLVVVIVFLLFRHFDKKKKITHSRFKPRAYLVKTETAALPFFLALMAWFILRINAVSAGGMEFLGRSVFSLFGVVGFYTVKTLLPFNLTVSVYAQEVFTNPVYIGVGILVCLGCLGLLYLQYRQKDNLVITSAISFYLLLIPSLFILFLATTTSLVGWRFLYLQSAIFTTLLVYYIFKWVRKKHVAVTVLVLLGLCYAIELFPKSQLFGRDGRMFWLSIDNLEHESINVLFNVGSHTLPVDEGKGVGVYEFLLEHRKESPKYERYRAEVFETLAGYYTVRGKMGEAGKYFDKALRLDSRRSVQFYCSYAYYLSLTGDGVKGEDIMVSMLKEFPENHLVLLSAARVYLRLGRNRRARELLEKDYRLYAHPDTAALLRGIQ